jgi:hypothetical protein
MENAKNIFLSKYKKTVRHRAGKEEGTIKGKNSVLMEKY